MAFGMSHSHLKYFLFNDFSHQPDFLVNELCIKLRVKAKWLMLLVPVLACVWATLPFVLSLQEEAVPFPMQHVAFPKEAPERAQIDELRAWVDETYPSNHSAFRGNSTNHWFFSALEPKGRKMAEYICGTDFVVLGAKHAVAAGVAQGLFTQGEMQYMPLSVDELYVSNSIAPSRMQGGGDAPLFATHLDGNLRVFTKARSYRALVYLDGHGTADVVAETSGIRARPLTYDVVTLDFEREYHRVEPTGTNASSGRRVLLKCHGVYCIDCSVGYIQAYKYLFYLTFHGVRRAMVYSKSPDTFTRRLLGVICNVISEVNLVQPVLPYLLISIVVIALCKLSSPRICGLLFISLLATIISGFDMFFCVTSFTHYLLYFWLIGSQGDKACITLRREAMWLRYISWGHLLESAYTFLEPHELDSVLPIIAKGALLMAVSSRAFTPTPKIFSGEFAFPYGWVPHPIIWDHFGFLLLLLSPGFDQEVGNLITVCMHVAAYSIVIHGEQHAMGEIE